MNHPPLMGILFPPFPRLFTSFLIMPLSRKRPLRDLSFRLPPPKEYGKRMAAASFRLERNLGAEGEPNSRYVLKSTGSVAEGVLRYLKEEIIERNS